MRSAEVAIAVFQLGMSMSFAQPQIVADPLSLYIPTTPSDTERFVDFANEIVVKCSYDFNNDGRIDLAISDHYAWGNAGGEWQIWLAQADGKYVLVDELFFHPMAINIRPERSGVGRVTVYHRSGGGEGDLIEYLVSDSTITEVQRTTVHPEEDEQSADSQKYRELFIDDSLHIPYTSCCRVKDLFFNRDSPWHDGYYILESKQ